MLGDEDELGLLVGVAVNEFVGERESDSSWLPLIERLRWDTVDVKVSERSLLRVVLSVALLSLDGLPLVSVVAERVVVTVFELITRETVSRVVIVELNESEIVDLLLVSEGDMPVTVCPAVGLSVIDRERLRLLLRVPSTD